jgi:secondary thiamine-phosphate synthase enzyme
LRVESQRAPQFIDLTDDVVATVASSGVRNGQVVVFSRHTTAAIRINEREPELLKDLEQLLHRLAPPEGRYFHNDLSVRTVNLTEDECPNGHAHCQHLLLSTSEVIPIVDGELQLGRWQRIFMIELDRPRTREVDVQVHGM